MSVCINIDSLSKYYKTPRNKHTNNKSNILYAVKNIDLQVQSGEIVGIIGPNGAGKSTLIKMMTGILVPSSGNIDVLGVNPFKDRKNYVKDIGVVFGQRSLLWWDLPAKDTFDLMKAVYKIPKSEYQQNFALLSEILQVKEFLDRPVRQLSLGQRMRCEIMCAFLHSPKVVFLDEPTIGLDVVAKYDVRNMIKSLNNERKTTIIITSHDVGDIEELCERLLIVDHGKKLYDGNLENIRYIVGAKKQILIRTASKSYFAMDGFTPIAAHGEITTFQINVDQTNVLQLVNNLSQDRNVLDIEVRKIPVEEIIRTIYTHHTDVLPKEGEFE